MGNMLCSRTSTASSDLNTERSMYDNDDIESRPTRRPLNNNNNNNHNQQEQHDITTTPPQLNDDGTPYVGCKCHEQFMHESIEDIASSYEDLKLNNHIGTDVIPLSTTYPQPIIHVWQTGPLACNTIVIIDPITKDAIIVDPGGPTTQEVTKTHKKRIRETSLDIRLQELGVNIIKIFITHAHFDHILGLGVVRTAYPNAKVYLHARDKVTYQFMPYQLSMMKIHIPPSEMAKIGRPDIYLNNDDPEMDDIGFLGGKLLFTPGHTPGSICLYFPSAGLLCSGDTLFKGAIGRTDLTGGSYDDIKHSILTQLYTLPDATMVIPGHGQKTLIGMEKRNNPSIKYGDPL